MSSIRIGLMGFGRIGRQIYRTALEDDNVEVVAISDIGKPHILHYLLQRSLGNTPDVSLEDNYLVRGEQRARLMPADHPNEIPWDVFGVDVVIDATGKYKSRAALSPHLQNGAPRVICTVLPEDELDRVVLFGVNQSQANAADRLISAGSASTTATALMLQAMQRSIGITQASMTSVHAYTSDQSLQDYAGSDYRRSRSGAENIIPNAAPAQRWLPEVLPALQGNFSAYALNVPVQIGSMVDVSVVLNGGNNSIDAINDVLSSAATAEPSLIAATSDPIVSSDVRGTTQSVLVDLKATMNAGSNMAKLIGWHETLGHAHRIIDLAKHYQTLDAELAEAS